MLYVYISRHTCVYNKALVYLYLVSMPVLYMRFKFMFVYE